VRGYIVAAAKLCSDFNDMHVSGFIPTGPPEVLKQFRTYCSFSGIAVPTHRFTHHLGLD
jgi:hypothetical protein